MPTFLVRLDIARVMREREVGAVVKEGGWLVEGGRGGERAGHAGERQGAERGDESETAGQGRIERREKG